MNPPRCMLLSRMPSSGAAIVRTATHGHGSPLELPRETCGNLRHAWALAVSTPPALLSLWERGRG
jgi:hypothetical protein